MFNCTELEKIFHKNVPFIDDGLYFGTRQTMLKHAKTDEVFFMSQFGFGF